jgi:hypothetical protein
MVDKESLEKQALLSISQDGSGVAGRLAQQFGVSRQAIHRHLISLVDRGLISAQGSTRALLYKLVALQAVEKTFACAGLSEDAVWRELGVPVLGDLPEKARDIWHYGLTEMVNNAIDHSQSPSVTLRLRRNALYADAYVSDEGVGIFTKIQRALGLQDPREAILELAKGKLSTDPARHSGEGIFFSSQAFDDYAILSGALFYSRSLAHPWGALIDHGDPAAGTLVRLRLAHDHERSLKAVFDAFAAPEEYSFAKTLVPVRLAQYEGEKLVSRSQAKRLTLRFEKFRQVVLDFEGVKEIGQAFADELFRVFARAHPGIELSAINTAEAVAQMMKRALAGAGPSD